MVHSGFLLFTYFCIVVCVVKAMAFPVFMYGCDSWTIKKADLQRIDAFELWSWRRLLRVPWPERRSNQSILKEINPEYSLKGLTLKLKLQYFSYLMQRVKSLEKTLILGKIEGRRRRGWQRMRWLDGITDFDGHEFEQTPGDVEGQRSLACCRPWVWREWDMTEQLNNKSVHMLILNSCLPATPSPAIPFSNCQFVFYVCESISAL